MKQVGWAVAGKHGLYVGWSLRRSSAIARHVHDLWSGREGFGEISEFDYRGLDISQARAWARCKKNGDYAVKVSISFKPRKAP